MFEFTVLDTQTGETPDEEAIALREEWARYLVYCDMGGFAITENGELLLLDECGNYRFCPKDRFRVSPNNREVQNIIDAANRLLDHIAKQYPGESLRCPHMQRLADACGREFPEPV